MSTDRDPVLTDLATLLDQLTGTGVPADPQPLARSSPPSDDLDQWVREHLAPVVERRVATGAGSGTYWCPQWWAHPEAVSRLHAARRAWDALRAADPTGISMWWLHHLDPHLDRLSAEYGPFHRCRPDKHVEPNRLPAASAPDDIRRDLPHRDAP